MERREKERERLLLQKTGRERVGTGWGGGRKLLKRGAELVSKG